MKLKTKKLLTAKDVMQDFANEPIAFENSHTFRNRISGSSLENTKDYISTLIDIHKHRGYSFFRVGTMIIQSFEDLEYNMNQPCLTSAEIDHVTAGADSILEQVGRSSDNESFVTELLQLYSGLGNKKIPCKFIFFNPKDKAMYVSSKSNVTTDDFSITSNLEGLTYREVNQSKTGDEVYDRVMLEIGLARLVETVFTRPMKTINVGEPSSETDDK